MKNGFIVVLLIAGIALSYTLGRLQPEPKHADGKGQAAAAATLPPAAPETVNSNRMRQQLTGLRFATVEKSEGARKIHLLGRVSPEDIRVYRVTAAVQGWVRETYGDSAGTAVKSGQILATYYSPEFVSFVNGYLTATERGAGLTKESARSVQYAADRLRALGMSEAQIKEIGETRQLPKRIDVASPTDGFILSRNITAGMRFEEQTEFYRIADLSHVWIIAEVFANEARNFRTGSVARVTLPGHQQPVRARVSSVLPQVDPVTRTLKVRLEAENPGFVLRPEMFVDVDLPVQTPSALTVPADAVLDSGLRQRVFVDRGGGFFESREVETGWRFGDRLQIVKGLSEGEKVVVPAAFLVDSESPLRTVAAGEVVSRTSDSN
jgi:membrane fusion protein, copper/silver efflux system